MRSCRSLGFRVQVGWFVMRSCRNLRFRIQVCWFGDAFVSELQFQGLGRLVWLCVHVGDLCTCRNFRFQAEGKLRSLVQRSPKCGGLVMPSRRNLGFRIQVGWFSDAFVSELRFLGFRQSGLVMRSCMNIGFRQVGWFSGYVPVELRFQGLGCWFSDAFVSELRLQGLCRLVQ